jgi:enamine deaminase RidA (YjgF/YER057c/UK114 family)
MNNKKTERVSSGAVWEDIVGYSRAIKCGNIIEVSGTIAIDENGKVVGLNDPYQQTKYVIQKAERAIVSLGGCLADVVRTRMFTTNISYWEKIGRAHGEFFREIKPATTMVEVSKLIIPETVVEIEFTVYL